MGSSRWRRTERALRMTNGKRAEEVDRLDRVRPGEGEGDDI